MSRWMSLVVLCVVSLVPAVAMADEERPVVDDAPPATEPGPRPSSAALFVNPAGILVGQYGAEVDVAVAERVSFNLSASYLSKGDTTGFGGGAGVQLFVTGGHMSGLYFYPQVSLAIANTSAYGVSASANAIGVGSTLGYQWRWESGFALRLGGGVVYYSALGDASDANGNKVTSSFSGVAPAVDLALGWTF